MSRPVIGTQNFDANVRDIQQYFDAHDAPAAVDAFLEDLETRIIPLLEVTPGIGAPFRALDQLPPDDQFVLERMQRRLKSRELRQIISERFTVLYLVAPRSVHLLAVRDQRQAAFRLG